MTQRSWSEFLEQITASFKVFGVVANVRADSLVEAAPVRHDVKGVNLAGRLFDQVQG